MDLKIPSTQKIQTFNLTIDKFVGATNTLLDEARANTTQATESINLMQVQDGLWSTKWGCGYYSSEIEGESSLDGSWEFQTASGDREIVVVGSTTGSIYKSADDGKTFTEINPSITMTPSNQCFFIQVGGELWISNCVDRLTIYNGTTVLRNTELSNPVGLTATRGAGLSTGSFTSFYQVVGLNSVGFTAGSNEATVTTNLKRDQWTADGNKNVALSWTALTGAVRYEIYLNDESGAKLYIDETTGTSYTDNGTKLLNEYREIPSDNTTGGPVLGQMESSNNRVWAIDIANKQVCFAGVGPYSKFFSYFYGGGFIQLDGGGRDTPIAVKHYRTGKGDPIATVICSSPSGRGSIWQVAMDSLTVGSTTVIVPTPVKIVSNIGTTSALGVTDDGENINFPNKQGIFSLRNKVQLFNVLATPEQSVNIRPSYRSIASSMFTKIAAYAYESKLLFSCSLGGSVNDTTFIYDTEHNNWSWRWTQGFQQFLEYTDTGESTHLLAVIPNSSRLVEIGSNFDTDLGVGFNTSYISPLIPINPKDKTAFATIDEAIVELGRPKGTVKFEVLGTAKNKQFKALASREIKDTVSNIDFTNGLWGEYLIGEDEEVPKTFAQASTKKTLKVRKLLNNIQFKISSQQAGTKYTILSIQAKGRIIPTKTPSLWNN